MKKNLLSVALIAGLFSAAGASAQNATGSGTVTSIIVYGDSTALVYGVSLPSSPCAKDAFMLFSTHPQYNRMMSQLLYARATGRPVYASLSAPAGCAYPILSGSTGDMLWVQ